MDQDRQMAMIEVLAEVAGLDAEDIKVEDDLVKDLGMDSLDLAKLEQSIEEEFEIEINARSFQGINTVQQLLDKMDSISGEAD